ncbi:30S ribosomal protein S17 [Candidatus Daviesbacteria bacterium]|nr:30S ribosomal protein S17 [Candidatus Daviesbacteria bacterium]
MSKVLTGQVVSDKMTKTVVVKVQRLKMHPLYKKAINWSKKFLADNQISAKYGDWVKISETRPLSKNKKWSISEIIKK